MNLEQLRKRAKDLVRSARDGDPAARARLGDLPVRLASAQLVLAREQGYASWPALVHALEATVESFVMAATSARCERAQRLLDARPEIARDRWAALTLGWGWDGEPNEVGGPRNWPPLHYACHSCFANVELVRELLDTGADPNAYFANEFGPMSVLFGAAGVLHNAELTTLLLEHGADPNGEPWFGDALYHSTEAKDPACLKTMLAHGAKPQGSSALGHALDYDHPEHVRLLLEAGDDPKQVLVHAVRRGRDLDCIRLLVEHGADLDYRGGEWSTPEEQYRTAYQNAILRGRTDVVEYLAQRGASTDVAPEDLAVAAIARGERPQTQLPSELADDAQEVLITAALDDKLDLVVDLLGPNYFGHVGGGPPGTLLHHASWVGKADLVRRLLERGADPVAPSGAEFDKPVAWAALASQWHWAPGRDYVAVVELLLAAGAELEPRFIDVAQGPLADWLEDHM